MARPEGTVDFTPSPAHYPFHSRWFENPAIGSEANLARWQAAFPKAEVVRLEQAGHYIQEDAPGAIIEAIVRVHGHA